MNRVSLKELDVKSRYKVSMVLPCKARPQRTRRSLECVLNQDLIGWELFFIGDGCSDYQELIDSEWFKEKLEALDPRNKIVYFNDKHHGGFGHNIVNYAIDNCEGEYFMWYANDDIILPNHMSNYYNEAVRLGKDLVYFDNYISSPSWDGSFTVKDAQFRRGACGHSELIVKSSVMKEHGKHGPEPAHDWFVAKRIADTTKSFCKSTSKPTYKIMKRWSHKDKGEPGID